MAGRILNRQELREQADQAVPPDAGSADEPAPKKGARAKKPATPRAKKARAKKVPPRRRARWGVFDGGMKEVAAFDYNQRAAAEQKLAQLLDKGKGTFFIQVVKEPMPEPAAPPAAP